EHLAISRFRAVETRRALVRSVNMGVSAVIDSSGRVLAPVKQPGRPGGVEVWEIPPAGESAGLPVASWAAYKQTEGIAVVNVPIDRRPSLYSRLGDWLPVSCGLAVVFGLGRGWWRRRQVGRPAPA